MTPRPPPSESTVPFTAAAAQIDIEIGRPAKNLERMLACLHETARRGAKLTVFPECALTGYCFDDVEEARGHAEAIPGPSTLRLAQACRELEVHAVFGLLEADRTRLFNACALVGPGGVLGSYRKIHLPHLGIDRFTTPGDRPFSVVDTGLARVGMNICYDGSFPESARVMALNGADVIVLPTNYPPGSECTAAYVINARALENNVYYMAVNRVGSERGFRFIGRSKVCDPSGCVLAEAAHDREEVLYAQIDPAVARRKHLVRVPEKHEIDRFKDRRPEMYGRIVE
jgi:predicted amidohydrolase